jgi:hypothetical protein
VLSHADLREEDFSNEKYAELRKKVTVSLQTELAWWVAPAVWIERVAETETDDATWLWV